MHQSESGPLRKPAVQIFCVVRCLLLDHFVGGGQQLFRNGEAERLGGFEIDGDLEFGRNLNQQGLMPAALMMGHAKPDGECASQ
jgi:hypothetical protein